VYNDAAWLLYMLLLLPLQMFLLSAAHVIQSAQETLAVEDTFVL